ncbi:hypothetical protein AGABI1DRAFT_70043 [Agaricus bisporus var. burnettii JB137-S8]|uniref:Uncharacterized protein n=1 Tax=Agaricus bisporus var. burnettii (strain JB137-S8 / ATCC MYA-4627 / FGSC 10392) TaxID=597362 RepID=K5Y1J9_AGABU|nr:uncharacterized protein AGABI1DRAFT_70043 [Agaricus bisporus var. burnettii JB137-S8]EKM81680.1 hypothetical protein AGABI1DRAFT_70043 [Agaricus bisporus var. burnettii JB137-S8]
MAPAPYSRVFVGIERIVAVSGSRVYILSSTTGDVIASHPNASSKEETCKQGPIVAAAVNEAFTYLLTVGETKMMQLWKLPQLDLINERELPKRPTGLAFTSNNQTILVSDKFGDVFSYSLEFTPPTTKPIPDEFSSHENPSDGKLVLGHASPLTAFLLSQDEKYIITADRDEHIRVSRYPQGYNIEMFCLGHCKYVSAIHLPAFSPDILISGGGDPDLKIWNWMAGECIGEVRIWESVEPFIAVKNIKGKRAEDGEGGEGSVTNKRKGKGKKKGDGRDDDEVNEQEGETVPDITEEKVLVVNKIASLQSKRKDFLLFSAVGATALFAFRYPKGSVENFDFGHPIIDFTVDQGGNIWVSLDTSLSTPGTESLRDDQLVRVIQIDENSKLSEVSHSQQNQGLLKSLNETCSNSDSPDKSLDFYADLKGMPKWSEPSSQTSADKEQDTKESSPSDTTTSTPTSKKTLAKRKELRMKNKLNVLAKMQSKTESEDNNTPMVPVSAAEKEKSGTVRPLADVEGTELEEDERETKRAKSGVPNGDAEMHS